MATVKDLLRAETLRLGSVAPVAGGNAVDLIGVAKAGTVKYVLPETGYVGLCARTPLNVWTGLECNGLAAQSRSNAGESFSTLYIYGRKGDSVNITVESTDAVGWLRFVKAIGGRGVNCPTLSAIFEKGGGLCLRLKTASETSVKQAADWLSHLHNAPSSSRLSAHRQSKGLTNTSRPQTAMSPYGLRAPLALRWSSVSITPYSSFHRTPPPRGGKRRYLVPVARSFTTHFGGAGSSEGRPTSFLLSVASNNARMEVAA